MSYDVLVIGGGIIGSAISYELSKYNAKILHLEKRTYWGNETSTGNSGVIHGGFDAGTGKKTAHYNIRGLSDWQTNIFPNLEFPRARANSLVIAFSKEENKEIEKLYIKGLKNGCNPKDIKIVDKEKLKKIEPNISDKAISALYCTSSWIIDPAKATNAFVGCAKQNGNIELNNSKVTSITKKNDCYEIIVNDKDLYKTRHIINAAGHFADEISKIAGGDEYKLTTKRGQYIVLAESECKKVNNICFMIPTIHGKGVIVAPMLDGRVLVGPTAKDGVAKEDTRILEKNIWDDIENIGQGIIKGLDYSKVELIYAGSRPIHKESDDFYIKLDSKLDKFIHVAGIKSPGISSAPAIANDVVKMLEKSGLILKKKKNFKPKYSVL